LDDLTEAATTATVASAGGAASSTSSSDPASQSNTALGVPLRNGPHGLVQDSNTGREIFASPLTDIRHSSNGKPRKKTQSSPQRKEHKQQGVVGVGSSSGGGGNPALATAATAATNAAVQAKGGAEKDPAVGTLGSGSDYTVFLDHFGIASLDFEFTPGSAYGAYHSTYDSFDWVSTVGGSEGEPDSAFAIMAASARIWGVLALRLAGDPLLPFDHAAEAKALTGYWLQLQEHRVQGLDLKGLAAAIKAYADAAETLQADVAKLDPSDASAVNALNERLSLTERRFLDAGGLPLRPWFKHTLQAPGLYLGYAAEAFPGVRQALDDGDIDLAQQQADIAAVRVSAAAVFLSGA